MASTYTPIATTTLGSASSTVSFTSISGSYTDLKIICAIGTTSGSSDAYIRFNGDTGNNYSITNLSGNGTSAASFRRSGFNLIYMNESTTIPTTPATFTADLQSYSNSTTYKTLLYRFGAAANMTEAAVALWRNTAAITQIDFTCTGTFVAGSTFTLYGIKAA